MKDRGADRGRRGGRAGGADRLDRAGLELLRAIALRAETARRLVGESGEAVLRAIVDATVALFQAEAASIALHDPATDRLVFRVAAGAQGAGVVGLSVGSSEGLVGYVYTTGQSIAQSDVQRDARFGRSIAEQTRYTPRSLIAVPLVDEQRTIGVLEILDKRDSTSFSIRDIELAGIFAHQAAVAISASRIERDVGSLLGATVRSLVAQAEDAGGPLPDAAAVERLVASAAIGLGADDEFRLWELVEQVARVRSADPAQLDLVIDLLNVLALHAERRHPRRTRAGG